VRRGAVDLHHEPLAIALFAHCAHSIRVLLLTAFGCRCLRAHGQKPPNVAGGRDVTAVPRPRVRGRPVRIALKKCPYLIGASEKRFPGSHHHDFGVRCEELQNALGIPRREPGAEALEDLEQRGVRLVIRPHGTGDSFVFPNWV
jgi:hypothetical protein